MKSTRSFSTDFKGVSLSVTWWCTCSTDLPAVQFGHLLKMSGASYKIKQLTVDDKYLLKHHQFCSGVFSLFLEKCDQRMERCNTEVKLTSDLLCWIWQIELSYKTKQNKKNTKSLVKNWPWIWLSLTRSHRHYIFMDLFLYMYLHLSSIAAYKSWPGSI